MSGKLFWSPGGGNYACISLPFGRRLSVTLEGDLLLSEGNRGLRMTGDGTSALLNQKGKRERALTEAEIARVKSAFEEAVRDGAEPDRSQDLAEVGVAISIAKQVLATFP